MYGVHWALSLALLTTHVRLYSTALSTLLTLLIFEQAAAVASGDITAGGLSLDQISAIKVEWGRVA